MAADLPPLADAERLGRGIFSSSQVNQTLRLKKAGKPGVPIAVFEERPNVETLSVDRLDHAPLDTMLKIGDRNARLRGPTRSFYGWATVTVLLASEMGRHVEATPRLDNSYHADIFLPLPDGEERLAAAREHAHDLALKADYLPRPP
jgi:hypothetical protein